MAVAITLSEADGVRYLHFGSEWVQGAMRIARPFALELEYQQKMMGVGLFLAEPRDILVLGLGAAALAKFCWRHGAQAQVRVIEVLPELVEVTRKWFKLPEDERLQLCIEDARHHLMRAQCAASADWLLVDLYDSAARGPVYDDPEFYRLCARALRVPGVAAFNLFDSGGRKFSASCKAIGAAFGQQVLVLPATAEGNCVVLAYRGGDFADRLSALEQQASQIASCWRLPRALWAGARATVRTPSIEETAAQFRRKLA